MSSQLKYLLDNAPKQLIIDHLTPDMRDLLNVLSIEDLIKLIATYGGTEFYIPYNAEDSKNYDDLVTLIGETAKKALFKYAEGCTYLIPSCAKLKSTLLKNAVIKNVQIGISQRDTALKFGITTRTVRRIIFNKRNEVE